MRDELGPRLWGPRVLTAQPPGSAAIITFLKQLINIFQALTVTETWCAVLESQERQRLSVASVPQGAGPGYCPGGSVGSTSLPIILS